MAKILEVKKINKTLAKKLVLKNVSFSVEEGEIYGFLGPNGAGKTTTMKCIMGLIKEESGSIDVFGTPNLTIKDKERTGFMPENTYLYKHLTGKEFLDFNGKFFGLKGKILSEKIDKLLERVGLEEDGNKYLHTYSKGMLQRIGLAQAIINDPKLLFLDEPMSGLDPIGRKMVKDLLVELNKSGTTIFFNTHILADVESICDRNIQ
ncbi:MAG: ABC transporter ATP-binding protein [Candidatus Gracilibacteria bacterium]|nr:ABC transporter ATP-binding protein [Candidatus Gracilibacteria bacterium]